MFEEQKEPAIKKPSIKARAAVAVLSLFGVLILSAYCYQAWMVQGKEHQKLLSDLKAANQTITDLQQENRAIRDTSLLAFSNQKTEADKKSRIDEDKIAAFALQAAACNKIRAQLHL